MAAAYSGFTNIWTNFGQIQTAIAKAADWGKKPIGDFIVIAHRTTDGKGLSTAPLRNSITLGTGNLLASVKPTFDSAAKQHGPARSWFCPGATVRFVGCDTSGPASLFALHVIRSGEGIFGATYAVGQVFGTLGYLDVQTANFGMKGPASKMSPAAALKSSIGCIIPHSQAKAWREGMEKHGYVPPPVPFIPWAAVLQQPNVWKDWRGYGE